MNGPITFEVVGLPAPQGSKTRMPNGAMVEGGSQTGRENHKSWRAAVTEAARNVAGHEDIAAPLTGPLHLTIEFRFPMPKSRPARVRGAGIGPKSTKPDLDKLLRSTGDSLTAAGLIRDDALIAEIAATKVEVIGWTGATITLSPLESPCPAP